MTPEQFEEIFEKVKAEAGCLETIRRYVLSVAIQGKLVSQNKLDEPAPELLKRILIVKSKNPSAAGRARRVDTEAFNHLKYEIPDSWKWTTLTEIGHVNPKIEADDHKTASFVEMASIFAEYGHSHLSEAKPWAKIKTGFTRFCEGDVGLAKITPCFENGKSAIFTNLENGIGAGTTELLVVRPYLVEPRYVLAFLKSGFFIGNGIPLMTGTAGQKRVPSAYFSACPFPLPPLEEQKRIVAKVDELMALCDELEDARDTELKLKSQFTSSTNSKLVSGGQIQNEVLNYSTQLQLSTKTQIEKYKQTMLELAMRGKLCKQLADDEPAHVTLKKIAHDMGKTISDEITPADKPFDLPDGWSWAHFSSLGEFGRGKSKHRPRNDPTLYSNGTYPFVQTGDVARSEGKITTFSDKYNDKGLDQSRLWPEGTLCITIAANIADTGILSFDACFPDSVVGFIPNELFDNARFFEYFLRTAKANLAEYAPATAQKNINLKILNAVLIPIPPLKEMKRIVEKLDGIMAECERLEASLGIEDNTKSDLLKTLVA
ncbi:restriction endonuclease subunit S [Roseobacter sp. HKCCD7870]|uniref:restriction endonuclease subunit S n=1 Tax=Roseobacter sp. HKCCD7870 TaxID=3120343 RepID=UPI0030ECFB2A